MRSSTKSYQGETQVVRSQVEVRFTAYVTHDFTVLFGKIEGKKLTKQEGRNRLHYTWLYRTAWRGWGKWSWLSQEGRNRLHYTWLYRMVWRGWGKSSWRIRKAEAAYITYDFYLQACLKMIGRKGGWRIRRQKPLKLHMTLQAFLKRMGKRRLTGSGRQKPLTLHMTLQAFIFLKRGWRKGSWRIRRQKPLTLHMTLQACLKRIGEKEVDWIRKAETLTLHMTWQACLKKIEEKEVDWIRKAETAYITHDFTRLFDED